MGWGGGREGGREGEREKEGGVGGREGRAVCQGGRLGGSHRDGNLGAAWPAVASTQSDTRGPPRIGWSR